MVVENKPCPYTGLRSFVEEESIYFRGRDEQIEQATRQLEEKKFLMVTGASGDGKSSIVYAGLIPHARAGFLKAAFTRWAVADFRPERDPLGNFAKALVTQFDGVSLPTIKTELSRGFSSLAMLYKNSSLYVENNDQEWAGADEKARKQIRRKAANLLILVDQFEEFFTNTENYRHGIPSDDASLVVNVLLETARIALQEKLPIYIVLTMRSDYIGQCASFRGLPENIGFSQFFIPRLNREEIKKVIKEPAELSGNKIYDRLVERLLFDMEEGIDQLPILQHALSRIWHFASLKNETMDLLHYAMAGGMRSDELPAEDQSKWTDYIQSQPPEVLEGFEKPGLKNILNLHANTLYATAGSSGSEGSKQEAVLIIRTTFKCLTKIDEEKAVRNRMSLQEITNIINRPDIDHQKIAGILVPFRQQGTTFLKPYLNSGISQSELLSPDDVLDISHESLIRNWTKLGKWAEEEYKHFKAFEELKAQVRHWQDNHYSSDFLLSVGSLNYFEEWKNEVNPNEWLINRYEKARNPDTTIDESIRLLDQIKAFIRKSAWKNIIARTVLKHGVKKIIAFTGTTLLIISCALLFISSRHNQNDNIIKKVKAEGMKLTLSPKVREWEKALFFISLYRQDSTAFLRAIDQITDTKKKLLVYQAIVSQLNFRDPAFRGYFMRYLFKESIQNLKELALGTKTDEDKVKVVELIHQFMLVSYVKMILNSHSDYKDYLDALSGLSFSLILELLQSPERYKASGLKQKYLNYVVETRLNLKKYTADEIGLLLKKISVFERADNKRYNFYAPEEQPLEGTNNPPLKMAAYQLLGEMYAYSGDLSNAKKCFDSLMVHNKTYYYYSPDFPMSPSMPPFALSINFLLNGHDIEFTAFNTYMVNRLRLNSYKHYTDFISTACLRNYAPFQAPDNESAYCITNIEDFDSVYLNKLFALGELEISKASISKDEKAFRLALLYKHHGLYLGKYAREKSISIDTASVFKYFGRAFEFFHSISKPYLSATSDFRSMDATTGQYADQTISRHRLFVYPDIKQTEYKYNGATYPVQFGSDLFLQYVIKNNLDSIYKENNSINTLGEWFMQFEESRVNNYYKWWVPIPVPAPVYSNLNQVLDSVDKENSTLYAQIIKLVVMSNDNSEEKVDVKKLLKHYQEQESYSVYNRPFLYSFQSVLSNVITNQGFGVIQHVSLSDNYQTKDYDLIKVLLNASPDLYNHKLYMEYYNLLDTGYYWLNKFRENSKHFENNPEYCVINGLLKMEDNEINEVVDRIIREADDGGMSLGNNKMNAIRRKVIAHMEAGDYYDASKAIPSTLSSTYAMTLYMRMLNSYREKMTNGKRDDTIWKYYDDYFKTAYFNEEYF